MAYSQLQKVETSMHIKSSAKQFYDLFCNRTHHISNMCPDIIQDVKIHQGEWGNEGSIIYWNYIYEGKTFVVKHVIEGVDRKNNIITFKAIDGGPLGYYKSFKVTLQVTPKKKGCEVHWMLEYEKQSDNIPDPHYDLHLAGVITKDIDAYLTKDQK
ncbi:hypothetical protein VNO77_27049 [Canavalia gladiata]|uniref:Bet v I/Major latex protein domain-containing protein n=1 Tax=Canavalia gladiata TaxID=3824 RepID=A0AAN9KW85_CANGL